MAYLDFAMPGGAAIKRLAPATMPALPTQQHKFGQHEWTIVQLARTDRLSSLREEGKVKRLLRLVFGIERQRPLADPRLEALRRMAVLSWNYGYNVSNSEVIEFLSAGYSIDHYEALLAHVSRERAASPRSARR